VACLAEAAVGCCRTYGLCSRGAKSGARSDDDAVTLVSNRVREELEAVTAADLLQVRQARQICPLLCALVVQCTREVYAR
jgi:hypothetical protein